MKLSLSAAWGKRDKLRAEAIIERFGNIKLEWTWDSKKEAYSCKLENGEEYLP
jgi:hypothetical protein